MIDLSVVFGTYNRRKLLQGCVESVRKAVKGLAYEVIVVDGGSQDGSIAYLREQPDVKLVEHGALRGPVAAYNDGFGLASGKFTAYLNDDLELQPGTLAIAVDMLERDHGIGVVSIPYRNPGSPVVSIPVATVNGRKKYPFASFGVLRREMGERAGWFTSNFYHYYGDITLCVNIQRMGYVIRALPVEFVATHHNADNAVRGEQRWQDPNSSAKQDGQAFVDYWKGKI